MKNYFFSRSDWGICYTVLAESKDKAIKIVKSYIKEEHRKERENTGSMVTQDNVDFWKKEDELRKKRIIANIHMDNASFHIEEYDIGEVIETEYA